MGRVRISKDLAIISAYSVRKRGGYPARRAFLLKSGIVAAVGLTAPGAGRRDVAGVKDAPSVTLVDSVTSLQSPFARWWSEGGRACALALHEPYVALENEGTLDQVVAQIEAIAARLKSRMVFNIDLGTRYSAARISEVCTRHSIYFVTHGSELVDLHPRNAEPYYVAHMIDDHYASGLVTGQFLASQVHRGGRILALGGPANDTAARLRKSGLDRALVEAQLTISEYREADWEPSLAYEFVHFWMQRFSDEIAGIWAANDPMALGAIEALRARGRIGRIPVTGIDGHPAALAAVQQGEMLATLPRDAFFEGGAGLAIALAASNGKLNPASMPVTRREIRLPPHLVNRENVADYVRYRAGLKGDFTVDRIWALTDPRGGSQ